MDQMKINKDILSQEDIQSIAKEISTVTVEEILASQQSLRQFILSGLTLIKVVESAQDNKDLKKAIIKLFSLITQLRAKITGEVYILNVETQKSGTIEVPLDTLFQEDAITLTNAALEYNLNQLKTELESVEIHQKLYDKLVEKIFPHCHESSAMVNFIYYHSNKTKEKNQGHFFEKHFAHYVTLSSSLAYFFLEQPKSKSIAYYRKSAKFYNRGHVYEWYIEDLNKKDLSNRKYIDPVAFMRAHKKDTVPFLAAGDITRQKNNQIQAVQIKRFNNHKLVTCTQLRSVLLKLQKLTEGKITKSKASKIIGQAFLGGRKQEKKVQQETKQHVEDFINNELLPKLQSK